MPQRNVPQRGPPVVPPLTPLLLPPLGVTRPPPPPPLRSPLTQNLDPGHLPHPSPDVRPAPDHQSPLEPTPPSASSPTLPLPPPPFQALLAARTTSSRYLPSLTHPSHLKHLNGFRLFSGLNPKPWLYLRDFSRFSRAHLPYTLCSAARRCSPSLSLRFLTSSPRHAFHQTFLLSHFPWLNPWHLEVSA